MEINNIESNYSGQTERELSNGSKLLEKMKPIYRGIVRIQNKEETGYDYETLSEVDMPTNEQIGEYLGAKVEYLHDLIDKGREKHNIGRQRELEQAEMRADLARKTLSGEADRPDLVVAEFVGLSMTCEKESVNYPQWRDMLESDSKYFRKLAETVAGRLGGGPVPDKVPGAIDSEVYHVTFLGTHATKKMKV